MSQSTARTSAHEPVLLDAAALEEVRGMMQDKFPEVLNYFLEDSAMYVQQIAQGFAAGEAETVVLPAHTLKSSAKQMGAMRLWDCSKIIEATVREIVKGTGDLSQIAPLVGQIQTVFEETRNAYQQLR
jgi:HPt (histidine-containing phosphotransfer) domain-containing protein